LKSAAAEGLSGAAAAAASAAALSASIGPSRFPRSKYRDMRGTVMTFGTVARAAMITGTVAAGAVAFGVAGTAEAQGLPNPLVATAYDVGSNGYSQAIAIGSTLKNEKGVTLRLLPGKNDVSRQTPLRDGKVHFSFSGIGGRSEERRVGKERRAR